MGGGAAQIDAIGASAIGQPAIPHERGQALALEDVAPGEPDPVLHIGWPVDVALLDQVGEPGREPLDRAGHAVADLVPALRPSSLSERVGYVLAEGGENVLSRGGDRWVVDVWK